MKLVVETKDVSQIGMLKLGSAVGKAKYSLVDRGDLHDIILTHKFDSRLEIDSNGDDLNVFAMAHPKTVDPSVPIPLHTILWEKRKQAIDPNFEVRHLNGITLDNRLENLAVVPKWISRMDQDKILKSECTDSHVWDRRQWQSNQQLQLLTLSELEGPRQVNLETRRGEDSLYWKAVVQLLSVVTDEHRYAGTACARPYFTTQGQYLSLGSEAFYYFECHNPPCTSIELEYKQFPVCPQCQVARYCSPMCQSENWRFHKDYCKELSGDPSASSVEAIPVRSVKKEVHADTDR